MYFIQNPLYPITLDVLAVSLVAVYCSAIVLMVPRADRKHAARTALKLYFIILAVLYVISFGMKPLYFAIPEGLSFLLVFASPLAYIYFFPIAAVGVLPLIVLVYSYHTTIEAESPSMPVPYVRGVVAPLGLFFVAMIVALVWLGTLPKVSFPDFEQSVSALFRPTTDTELTPAQKDAVIASPEFNAYLNEKTIITSQQGSGPVRTYYSLAALLATESADNQKMRLEGEARRYVFLNEVIMGDPTARKRVQDMIHEENIATADPVYQEFNRFFVKYGVANSTTKEELLGQLGAYLQTSYRSGPIASFLKVAKSCPGKNVLVVVPTCLFLSPVGPVVFR